MDILASERNVNTPTYSYEPVVERLLGPEFRVEIRGALAIRRIYNSNLHSDAMDDLRSEALVRYLEKREKMLANHNANNSAGNTTNQNADISNTAPEVRSLASVAVYHILCRDRRRTPARRVRSINAGDDAPSIYEWPDFHWESSGANATDKPDAQFIDIAIGKRSLRKLVISDDAVGAARCRVRCALSSAAETVVMGRGGSEDEAEPLQSARVPGVVRWLNEFEGDRGMGSLAKGIVTDAAVVTKHAAPRQVVRAVRESARWQHAPANSFAKLALSAITNPK
ncbi:MAG: hypothetical protein ACKVS6_08515 [Planctomycetota bacterium]